MIDRSNHRFLLSIFLFWLAIALLANAQPSESKASSNAGSNRGSSSDRASEDWDWNYSSEEGGGSSYLGVDICDVTAERLTALKLKEEHGAEVTMVDQDAPAGKAGLHEHDVIVSLNDSAVESAAQLRRMIKETPPGRVVSLGISRDGQPLTIKVQLADRHKSMTWAPKVSVDMPKIELPAMPDFDLPVSVVVVHSSARSGLMVENITPQLGDFFGIKSGHGVLVRSVEKGSRGEKAGFRAGDVVIKVNNQPVHDTSDFMHALRSSSGSDNMASGNTVTVTVVRDKKEQNLILTLPARKESGNLLEESFDIPDLTAETEEAIDRAGDEIARLGPAMGKVQQSWCTKNAEQMEKDSQLMMQERQKEMQERQQEMQERQKQMQERQQKLSHELSGEWLEI